jgi:soluble lytic murein transglycosylase-like protein
VTGVGLAVSSHVSEADPADDFRMTLGKSSEKHYRLISESTVARILSDRLDSLPKSEAPKFARHLIALCQKHRFDPAFVLSLIDVESRFQVKVVSSAGAIGLMQVMVPTAHFVLKKLGAGVELPFAELAESKKRLLKAENVKMAQLSSMLKEPYANTAIGIAYLGWLRDYYEGMPPYYVVAAYNVGPARLDELLARKSFKPRETKKYYAAILKRIHKFRYYDGALTKKSKASKTRVL